MNPKYTTLKTIYEIVKKEKSPTTYACSPRQIILHQSQGWDAVVQHLNELEAEELITRQQPANTICITAKGIEQIRSAETFA